MSVYRAQAHLDAPLEDVWALVLPSAPCSGDGDARRVGGGGVWEVFSEVHHELEEIIEADDGETVVSVQRTQALMRHKQLQMDLLWAAVWTVRDGKAVRGQG